jgi:ABC-type sugar transport system permease subunit
VFTLPYVIGILVLFAFPVFTSLRISLSDITRFSGFKMEWIGFEWRHKQ